MLSKEQKVHVLGCLRVTGLLYPPDYISSEVEKCAGKDRRVKKCGECGFLVL